MTMTVSWQHLLLAVLVMAIWGTNFTITALALQEFPPLVLAALRFLFAFFPVALFVRRPAVAWSNLAAYGVLIGLGQFGLMFFAMTRFISPGLASLVIQTQAIFTVLLAVVLTREHVRPMQWLAILLAAAGVAVILVHRDGQTTVPGVAMILGAAMCWSVANMVSRAAGQVDMLAYVVWGSLFSFPPLMLAAVLGEGWGVVIQSMTNATWIGWSSVFWQAFANAIFGYGIWAWLLSRHPAATIAPMSLLVPVFGMLTSALVLHEPMQSWKLLAAALVLGGLALGLMGPKLAARFGARP
jgi:O-acetylserine/cysteine efflux transporter